MKLRHYSPIHFGARLLQGIGGGSGQSVAIAQPPSGGGLNQKLLHDLARLRPIRRRLPRAFVIHQSRVGAVAQVRVSLACACVQVAVTWSALPRIRSRLPTLFVAQLSSAHMPSPVMRFGLSRRHVISDDEAVAALNLWHQRASCGVLKMTIPVIPISLSQEPQTGRIRIGGPAGISDEEAVAAVLLWRHRQL